MFYCKSEHIRIQPKSPWNPVSQHWLDLKLKIDFWSSINDRARIRTCYLWLIRIGCWICVRSLFCWISNWLWTGVCSNLTSSVALFVISTWHVSTLIFCPDWALTMLTAIHTFQKRIDSISILTKLTKNTVNLDKIIFMIFWKNKKLSELGDLVLFGDLSINKYVSS